MTYLKKDSNKFFKKKMCAKIRIFLFFSEDSLTFKTFFENESVPIKKAAIEVE